MAKSFRSKPVGWQYESNRHSLSAQGISTSRKYRATTGLGRFVESMQKGHEFDVVNRQAIANVDRAKRASLLKQQLERPLSQAEELRKARLELELRYKPTVEKRALELRALDADAQLLGYHDGALIFLTPFDFDKARGSPSELMDVLVTIEQNKSLFPDSEADIGNKLKKVADERAEDARRRESALRLFDTDIKGVNDAKTEIPKLDAMRKQLDAQIVNVENSMSSTKGNIGKSIDAAEGHRQLEALNKQKTKLLKEAARVDAENERLHEYVVADPDEQIAELKQRKFSYLEELKHGNKLKDADWFSRENELITERDRYGELRSAKNLVRGNLKYAESEWRAKEGLERLGIVKSPLKARPIEGFRSSVSKDVEAGRISEETGRRLLNKPMSGQDSVEFLSAAASNPITRESGLGMMRQKRRAARPRPTTIDVNVNREDVENMAKGFEFERSGR